MKYMLMLVRDDDEWEALTDAERDMPAIGAWFMDVAAKGSLRDGEQLHAARTATVRKCWFRDMMGHRRGQSRGSKWGTTPQWATGTSALAP